MAALGCVPHPTSRWVATATSTGRFQINGQTERFVRYRQTGRDVFSSLYPTVNGKKPSDHQRLSQVIVLVRLKDRLFFNAAPQGWLARPKPLLKRQHPVWTLIPFLRATIYS